MLSGTRKALWGRPAPLPEVYCTKCPFPSPGRKSTQILASRCFSLAVLVHVSICRTRTLTLFGTFILRPLNSGVYYLSPCLENSHLFRQTTNLRFSQSLARNNLPDLLNHHFAILTLYLIKIKQTNSSAVD